MAIIYIDTNVYLDFYQSAKDRLAIFEEIEKFAENIVLTEQTFWEFLRNRNSRLAILANDIAKSVASNIHTTAIVREMPEFSEIDKAQKQIKDLSKKIRNNLLSWKEDASADPVFLAFERILHKAKYFKTTETGYSRAKRRKYIGNPPTSPDKHTIGDELIWETLLESCKEDLAIVSRDQTFLTNLTMLKVEFETNTGKKLLLVTDDISKALKSIGQESPRLEIAEQEVAAEKAAEKEDYDAKQLGELCPKCGGPLAENGYDAEDGGAWWLDCTKCGATFFPRKQ
jgi:hypothetical protein